VLEAAIKKYLRHIHIPAAELYRGNLRRSLENIWGSPEPPEKLSSGGDEIAARRICALFSNGLRNLREENEILSQCIEVNIPPDDFSKHYQPGSGCPQRQRD